MEVLVTIAGLLHAVSLSSDRTPPPGLTLRARSVWLSQPHTKFLDWGVSYQHTEGLDAKAESCDEYRMGFRLDHFLYVAIGEIALIVAGAWFEPQWIQDNTILLLCVFFVLLMIGGTWRNSYWGRKMAGNSPSEKAKRWRRLAQEIMDTLDELKPSTRNPAMDLPRTASDEEHERAFLAGIKADQESMEHLGRVMKRKFYGRLSTALSETRKHTSAQYGGSERSIKFFTVNALAWEDAANFLFQMAAEVDDV